MEILFAAANNTGGSGCCPVLGLFQSVGVPSEAVGVPAPPVPSEGWTGWTPVKEESEAGGGKARRASPARPRGGQRSSGDHTMFLCVCLLAVF